MAADLPNDLEMEVMELVRALNARQWEKADNMQSAIELLMRLTDRVLDLDAQNRQLRAIIKNHFPSAPPLPKRVA